MGNEVECTACGLRLQVRGKGKFEIERHWETKHKDRVGRESASFKLVSDGFHNVDSRVCQKTKDISDHLALLVCFVTMISKNCPKSAHFQVPKMAL